MANTSTIGTAATIIASLITFAYTISGFTQISAPQPPSTYYSGFAYYGWAVMGWFGVLSLSFCWTGMAYAIKRSHFALAVTGASLIFASCIVEFFTFKYAPATNSAGPSLLPLASALPLIVVQMILSLAGIILISTSKSSLTTA